MSAGPTSPPMGFIMRLSPRLPCTMGDDVEYVPPRRDGSIAWPGLD